MSLLKKNGIDYLEMECIIIIFVVIIKANIKLMKGKVLLLDDR
jgi:hypothetical protein